MVTIIRTISNDSNSNNFNMRSLIVIAFVAFALVAVSEAKPKDQCGVTITKPVLDTGSFLLLNTINEAA